LLEQLIDKKVERGNPMVAEKIGDPLFNFTVIF
jgi:hypothetical protein